MKRKWPGVNKQLEILNKGLREQYGNLVWSVNRIVRDAEKDYGRGSFDTALTELAQDHFGTHGPHDGFFDKWRHNGFSAPNDMVIDWFGTPEHCSNVTHSNIQIRFDYPNGEWKRFCFPVTTIRNKADRSLQKVQFRIPEFVDVRFVKDAEEIDTAAHDERVEEMKRLIIDLHHCINPLMRIVLGEARQKRYRIRDEINDVARKYNVKEAIYEEDE